MADKKITINPGDMQRLRELMRQEEEKLDAANPSDAELSEWEEELEASVRKLAERTPDELPTQHEEMNGNWEALQQKLTNPPKAVPEPQKSADILPLQRSKKNLLLPFLGFAAAAALTLIMVRPDDKSSTTTGHEMQVKGPAGEVAAADCEWDAASLDGSSVTVAANAQGFVGNPGAIVELSVRCSAAGILQATIQGPDSFTLAVPVKAGERQGIIREGKVVRFPLQSGTPWSISVVLLDREPGKDAEASQDRILWQDSFSVGAHE